MVLTPTESLKYKIIAQSGIGGFSTVYKVKNKTANRRFGKKQPLVAKVLEVRDESDDHTVDDDNQDSLAHRTEIELLHQEVSILKRVQNNRHVVKYVDSFWLKNESMNAVWIIMEELPMDLVKLSVNLNISEIAVVAKCLLCAVEHIHSKGVIHRDIKYENILLSQTGCLKLCDFGAAETFESGQKKIVQQPVGTGYTRALEMWQVGAEYDETVDVWSLGVLIYMLTVQTPEYCSFYQSGERLGEHLWEAYLESDEEFFESAFELAVFSYMNIDHVHERLKVPSANTPEFANMVLQRSQKFRDVFDFSMACVVPLSSSGPEHRELSRKSNLTRATLKEAKESKLVSSAVKGEVSQRQVIIRLLKDMQKV